MHSVLEQAKTTPLSVSARHMADILGLAVPTPPHTSTDTLKYLCFNKFSLLYIDSLDKFDSDISNSIHISVPVDTLGSTSSISYKTPNRSTISTKNTHKDSVSFRQVI